MPDIRKEELEKITVTSMNLCYENMPSFDIDKNKILNDLNKLDLNTPKVKKPEVRFFLRNSNDICMISFYNYDSDDLNIFKQITRTVTQSVTSVQNTDKVIDGQLQNLQKKYDQNKHSREMSSTRSVGDYLFEIERQPNGHDYRYYIAKKRTLAPDLKPLAFDVASALTALEQTGTTKNEYIVSPVEFSSLYYNRMMNQITFPKTPYTYLSLFGDELDASNLNQLQLLSADLHKQTLNEQTLKIIQSFSVLISTSEETTVLFNQTVKKFEDQVLQNKDGEKDVFVEAKIEGYKLRMNYTPVIKQYTVLLDKL